MVLVANFNNIYIYTHTHTMYHKIYIHIYTHIHHCTMCNIYIYIYTHTETCTHHEIYICMHTWIWMLYPYLYLLKLYAYTGINTLLYRHILMHRCIYTYVYIYIYIYIYIYFPSTYFMREEIVIPRTDWLDICCNGFPQDDVVVWIWG